MTAVITKGKTENSVFPRDNQPAGNCWDISHFVTLIAGFHPDFPRFKGKSLEPVARQKGD